MHVIVTQEDEVGAEEVRGRGIEGGERRGTMTKKNVWETATAWITDWKKVKRRRERSK